MSRVAECIDRGLESAQPEQEPLRKYVKEIKKVSQTLEPTTGNCAERRRRFKRLAKRFQRANGAIYRHMARVMISFLPGLFAGGDRVDRIQDNLDLERWFRLPKSHERRIHGHRHAGVRIVQEGPTLVPALDAHAAHPGPFTVDDLLPYRTAREPTCQGHAITRRKIMRKARSKTKRRPLLAELERRYLAAS